MGTAHGSLCKFEFVLYHDLPPGAEGLANQDQRGESKKARLRPEPLNETSVRARFGESGET